MSDEYNYLIPEEQAAELKARAEAAKRRWKQGETKRFWQRVLSDPVGRAEIWRILDELNTFRTEFRAAPSGTPDKYATWFWHGRSTYGFEFYQQLCVAAREQIAAMHDEHDVRYAKEPIGSDERDDDPYGGSGGFDPSAGRFA